MRFEKLRLSSFKSFVDPTDLLIQPGLTGVVGPNGCGKSNLIEALRWVMGESSAKQMRGDEMDDVIFGGTSDRPARNIAEVSVLLDNSERRAPAIFNDTDELEVTRRIERGSGSVYRVNGREVRARDVQLLFADAASGARSPALVSQGQVGAFIAAKPVQRRALLEEAAGISGLYSRRHEAELRLRAASTNLERLDDVIATLEAQLQALKRQARQATRYRNLSDHIRRAEAMLFHLRWLDASDNLARARDNLQAIEARVVESTRAAGVAAAAQGEAAVVLPAVRQAEVEAAAELQRLRLAHEGLEAEEHRLAETRRNTEERLSQISADIGREQTLGADAEAALERLAREREALANEQAGQEGSRQGTTERLATVAKQVADLEAELTQTTERLAQNQAQRAAATRQLAEAEDRLARLRRRREEIGAELDAAEAATTDQNRLHQAELAVADARQAINATMAEADSTEEAALTAREAEAAAREALQEVEARAAKLRAQATTLADLLSIEESDRWPPLIDSVTVEPGYEMALGVALGDDLDAATNDTAPVHWRELRWTTVRPGLPEGAEPLTSFVQAPSMLEHRLSQIGVVASTKSGAELSQQLAIGQRLVSRDGALWRWDGYTVAAGAPTPAAKRLSQRNRHAEVREALPAAEAALAAARQQLEAARMAGAEAGAGERAARDAVRAAQARLGEARDVHGTLAEKAAAQHSRLAALADAATRLRGDLDDAEKAVADLRKGAAVPAQDAEMRQRVEDLRIALNECRGTLIEAQSAHDRMAREGAERERRLEAIAGESDSWRSRTEDAVRQLAALAERQRAARDELDDLARRPEEIARQRQGLLQQLEASERRRRDAADALATAEGKLAEQDRALKQSEAALAADREERIRAEAAVEQAEQAARVITERVAERLQMNPGQLADAAGLEPDDALPELEAIERRVERLHRERENMGEVNLRADAEAREMDERIAGLHSEREDLIAAIEKLRRGINELNREGRQRLLAAFDEVNSHFEELFVRLFGGGRAHLTLTESDDPLEAGLEIMASPPGKRLQVLSLLSGGERALTALALLFAVFLTNPAPVCVLDEVDAPLDDANVDRFCLLLEEIAHGSATRFLLVTHHRMTMARMDRLYGVTMAERGVSQLVSVDLTGAERLRATG